MKSCLFETSAEVLPPPLKLKEIGAAMLLEVLVDVDDCSKLNTGAGAGLGTATGAVGGVLGAVPKEKGAGALFTSFAF